MHFIQHGAREGHGAERTVRPCKHRVMNDAKRYVGPDGLCARIEPHELVIKQVRVGVTGSRAGYEGRPNTAILCGHSHRAPSRASFSHNLRGRCVRCPYAEAHTDTVG